MSDEIVFYYNPRSRAQIVRWMLEEVGAPYRIVPIDFEKNEQRSPDFLAVNPMGKIPTIVHKGVVVTEAAAIIAYLADAFPAANLAPALDDPARGTYFRWLVFGASSFEPALLDKMMKRPEVSKMTAGWGDYDDVVRTLKTALTPGPYLLGERFTAADIYIGAEISWAMMFGAPDLKGDPVFDAYVARTTDRDAYKRSLPQ